MSNTTDSLARQLIEAIALNQVKPEQTGSGGVRIHAQGRQIKTNPPPPRELDSRTDLYE